MVVTAWDRTTIAAAPAPASRRFRDFAGGIPYIVAGMKTLLETGEPISA